MALHKVPSNRWSVMAQFGPSLPISQELHAAKYRTPGETFDEAMCRVAGALGDGERHFRSFLGLLRAQRFMPAGRVQSAMGAPRAVTPYNCFVSGVIEDSMASIMRRAGEAAETMRRGGGIGYDFSNIRPTKSLIRSMGSSASGPRSFMDIFDAVCGTISSAGERRGAQMGVLRIDHPDIEIFINAKQNQTDLTRFNLSTGIIDSFMNALLRSEAFDLVFEGEVHSTVSAQALWDKLMRATWDWAEPGVLFLDTINRMNNLYYCETISSTNPCAEQPLPPFGACLLGSFNLAQYIIPNGRGGWTFDRAAFTANIPTVVRAMDNVVDRAIYPLPEQEMEAKSKRRMGLGYTGLANAGEAMGFPYGSDGFDDFHHAVGSTLMNEAYRASALLAAEKGAFPLFDREKFLDGNFVKRLDPDVRDLIAKHGIRNSHLTSIAPTGTISLCADNVSSGIEPVFMPQYERTIQTADGPRKEIVQDYGVRVFGVEPRTAEELSVKDHLQALLTASQYMDSAVSKTCNIGDDVTWDEFKQVYVDAWKGGAKGCTTFRRSGKRYGILNAAPSSEENQGAACYIDPDTGKKTCE